MSDLSTGLPNQIGRVIRDNKQRVEHLSTLLETLGPSATLKRGYAIITDENGKVVRSTAQAAQGDHVELKLEDGRLQATVDKITQS